jgi:hypothetical protein
MATITTNLYLLNIIFELLSEMCYICAVTLCTHTQFLSYKPTMNFVNPTVSFMSMVYFITAFIKSFYWWGEGLSFKNSLKKIHTSCA